MAAAFLNKIEEMISHLSPDEQMYLIENMARCLRGNQKRKESAEHALFRSQLAAMAEDPELQDELRKISQEFAPTESNGLGGE